MNAPAELRQLASRETAVAIAQCIALDKLAEKGPAPRGKRALPWGWDCTGFVWFDGGMWHVAQTAAAPRAANIDYVSVDANGAETPYLFM